MPDARLGFGLAGAAPIATIEALATAAEEYDFSSFWLSHPSPPIPGTGLEALGRAAKVTSTIPLGIGVIPLADQSAEQILRSVADFQLPPSRFRLGIGSGTGPRPIARVRHAAEFLRDRLDCELTLAALGPEMLRLAGQYADCVLLNWLSPEYAGASSEVVRQAARDSGRKPPRILAYVRVALGVGSDQRRDREAAMYAAVPQYSAHFARMGSTAYDVVIHAREPREVANPLKRWRNTVDEVIVRALPGDDSIPATRAILDAARDAW